MLVRSRRAEKVRLRTGCQYQEIALVGLSCTVRTVRVTGSMAVASTILTSTLGWRSRIFRSMKGHVTHAQLSGSNLVEQG